DFSEADNRRFRFMPFIAQLKASSKSCRMTYLRFPTYDGASLARRSDQIAGFLHRLIEALHHSRRLQAAVVIRQYKHLVDPDR
ncbi:MAG TPA: hypothetical protein VK602_13480, partial [Phyllobacterium sp.]|nr:hypothetical protein [Phyllobacterium sp.]